MRRFLIEWLGGYPDFESALTALKKSDNVAEKNALLTEAVKKLFNTIGADDILRVNESGVWLFQGKPLAESEVQSIKQDALLLKKMKLWQILRLDVKYQVNKKMFEESRITEDVLWGKLILWHDDVIRTRIRNMK